MPPCARRGRMGSLAALALILALVPTTSAPIEGLTCTAESVEQANSAQLHSILAELADSTFFRLVRVTGDGRCPMDDALGGAPESCAAPVLAGGDANPFSSAASPFSSSAPPAGPSLCSVEAEPSSPHAVAAAVDTQISPAEASAHSEFPTDTDCVVEGTFAIRPDYWLDICDSGAAGPAAAAAEYVNLQLNPERNTGYNGAAVWAEMHRAVAHLRSPEGRMLQRLVSGYHTSVATQIYANYFPPPRQAAAEAAARAEGAAPPWRPNAAGFRAKAAQPAWIADLQFAFVVTARSLWRIKDHLYNDFAFVTGNATEDASTRSLIRHLLDSAVLSSCGSVVVSGFDESRLFPPTGSVAAAATDFKQTFRRVSRLVHCVACKRCRLHATVALHGLGAAIKILFSPPDVVARSLSRADVVALVNTVHRLSDSIALATQLLQEAPPPALEAPKSAAAATGAATPSPPPVSAGLSEDALAAVAAARANLTRFEEDALVSAIVRGDAATLVLAGAFLRRSQPPAPGMFLRHALIALGIQTPDAVIVGGGLAGLITALSLAERGGAAVLLEKQRALGGNSAKASSGINSLRGEWGSAGDSAELFLADTLRSQGGHGDAGLAAVLVREANASVAWLERATGLALPSVAQLGGHAAPRTWKPADGLVGAELVAALSAAARRNPAIRIVTQATATRLVAGAGGAVEGVEYLDEAGRTHVARGRAVVLASGGFGFDTAGLLREHRPDLVGFPTTLGAQTTGDGIRLAAAAGAGLVDMSFVQLHPTGFVDPRDPSARVKVLAAEVLRGVGGVLLLKRGADGGSARRFVNELGTRKAVTDRMLAESGGSGAGGSGSVSGGSEPSPAASFWVVLSARSAALAPNHARMYVAKGLLRNVTAAAELEALLPGAGAALRAYSADAEAGRPDAYGRADRLGLPYDEGPYWLAGEVTPVVHYTMGGVRVDALGRVLAGTAAAGAPIPGLYAAGEVTGGVHGENRLGGNSLLECTVYGRVIGGSALPVSEALSPSDFDPAALGAGRDGGSSGSSSGSGSPALLAVTPSELAAHATPADCWTAIRGAVYDLSGFSDEHAGGVESITEACGVDSTARFLAAHTEAMLGPGTDFPPLGRLVVGPVTA